MQKKPQAEEIKWDTLDLELNFDDAEYQEDDYGGCYECGGRGWTVDCCDDLCHGQDECIHGDPPSPCRNCNADGKKEDGY